MSGPRIKGASPSRKAARMYLRGGVTVTEAAERYEITPAAVHNTLRAIRQRELELEAAGRAAWPEDECTC